MRYVFGIPGGLLYPFFAAVEEDPEMDLVVARHEEGAAFMADGYARVSHRLAVCAGTSGPGSTNLLTGIACSFADGVPVLVLTGQPARHALGKGAAQEASREDMDIVAMFRPITKYSAMVTSADSMGMHLRRSLRLAMTGRPGPVHLNVPVDLWGTSTEETWFDPLTYRPPTATFDRGAVKRATEALLGAERPVILVGSGVGIAEAQDHVLTLAELLPARVATTPRAKGLFPEDHPLSLGVLGVGGHSAAHQTLLGGTTDVLLTAGASLNETATFNWSPLLRPARSLIQLDIDADRLGRNYPVDIPLLGDAQTILVEIAYHAHRSIREGAQPRSRWPEAPPVPCGHDRYLNPALRTSDQSPLTPQRWRYDLGEALPDNALVFSDIGAHMLFNLHHLCIRAGQRFFINLGFGSMGHGTVAPIGASLAYPGRPVFALIGDGCFAMNGMDLLTACDRDVPVVWIVETNNMHAITWHCSALLGKSSMEAARFRRPMDVAGIARAMGLYAWMVDRPGPLPAVLPEALARRGPCLNAVRVAG
ncbi:MAG: thiamine pyrophosphate-binding protein, partial [Deltaproteobacteria bacterium]|nr:thiamine pyrophosphate-binding protein [Deltaproteobacteria bacterium]